MAENLSLPNIPTSTMFEGDPEDKILTTEWQEFFRGLHDRVGGLSAPTINEVNSSMVAEAYKTEDEDPIKRLEELEKKLASLPTPKSYDKKIDNLDPLKQFAETIPSQPPDSGNEIIIVLDTNEHSHKKEIDEIEFFISAVQAGDT